MGQMIVPPIAPVLKAVLHSRYISWQSCEICSHPLSSIACQISLRFLHNLSDQTDGGAVADEERTREKPRFLSPLNLTICRVASVLLP